jgi:hypothetical protein
MESSIIDNEEEIEKGDGVEILFLNKMDNELKVMETPETFTISFDTD